MNILHYVKVAFRVLLHQKLITAINLFSLSAGICAVLVIAGYIEGETDYDSFHKKGDRIFRVGFDFWEEGKLSDAGIPDFSAMFGPDAQAELTGIERFCRTSGSLAGYLSYGDKSFKMGGITYADSSFFHIFSFRILAGDPSFALKTPGSVVLSRSTATKIFGTTTAAMGKTVRLDNQKSFRVTGIVEDAPRNSSIGYTALLSFSTLNNDPDAFLDWRGGYSYTTYLLLNRKENMASLEKSLSAFMWRHINKRDASSGSKTEAHLQPLKDIHLNYSPFSNTLRRDLKVFGLIALLILVISCVNYINFNTAQALTRFKEIGIRRVLGAEKTDITLRWVTESVIITSIAFILALGFMIGLVPLLQQYAGIDISVPGLFSGGKLWWPGSVIFILLSGGAGTFLSGRFGRLNVKQNFQLQASRGPKSLSKNFLITFQYVISIILICCTLIVYAQIRYMKGHSTGLDGKNVMIIPLPGMDSLDATYRFKMRISQLSSVASVTALSEVPVSGITSNGFFPEGHTEVMMMHQLDADGNFLKTFGIKLLSGDFFSKNNIAGQEGYIVNETLIKKLGWRNPIGKIINRDGPHPIIGVVKDFNFTSLRTPVEPLIITNIPWKNYECLAVRYHSNPTPLLHAIKDLWDEESDLPFEYWFLDSAFDWMYKAEQQFMNLLLYFSILSITLSLSGVLGLVSLNIEKRLKEISIRKVLGASLTDIVTLSSSVFLRMVFLAALIAFPIGYFLMIRWLRDFPYRITVHWWMFALTGLAIMAITLLIICMKVIKAAMTNPASILRNE